MKIKRILFTVLFSFFLLPLSTNMFQDDFRGFSETENCSNRKNSSSSSMMKTGGEFSKCDGRLIGPTEICTEYWSLYNVTNSEVRNSCNRVKWSFAKLSGIMESSYYCEIFRELWPFRARVYPEGGCPGEIKITATASSSNCGKECGSASLRVDVVKWSSLSSINLEKN